MEPMHMLTRAVDYGHLEQTKGEDWPKGTLFFHEIMLKDEAYKRKIYDDYFDNKDKDEVEGDEDQ